jgi:hypothetical protein
LLTLVFSLPASAASNKELVAPLENALLKNSIELNIYLQTLGFTAEELAPMSIELKKEIASNGGIKIKAQKLNPELKTYDMNGNDITDTIFSTHKYTDSKTTMFGYAIKTGRGSKENTYDLYAQYTWNSRPNYAFTDTLAMSWQSHVTPYGDPYSVHNWRNYPEFQYTNKLQSAKIEGSAVEIDLIYAPDPQDGYMRQTVKVDKSYEGKTGAVALAYAHTKVPTIVEAVLNYFSISFSGFSYEEYTDRFNFTF